MRCLAVNTATTVLSVALLEDERQIFHRAVAETRDQGNLLLEYIREGLGQGRLDYAGLDLLSVVTGPGSFTGIRIGLAAMRGISLAAGIPVMGVSSFDMFRSCADAADYNIIAVESWREELYFAVFDRAGKEVIPPVNETAAVFARRCEGLKGNVVLGGDAREKLAAVWPGAKVAADLPDARQAARLAMERMCHGEKFQKPEPFYLREADVTMPKIAPKTV